MHYRYHAVNFGIDTIWQMGDAKQGFSFMYNWSANQRNCATSWELEQEKTRKSQWILTGKAEDVCSEQFNGSVISESQ